LTRQHRHPFSSKKKKKKEKKVQSFSQTPQLSALRLISDVAWFDSPANQMTQTNADGARHAS
jgi:hypothetical protein